MKWNVEHAVVGAAVASPDRIPEILSKVSPQDMHDPKAEAVLGAVLDMWADGIPVDTLSVVQRLAGGQVTGMDVFAMVEQAAVPAALSHHLSTVADKAAVRRLSQTGYRIAQLAERESSPQVIAQQAQQLLDGVVRPDESQVRRVGDTLDDTVARVQAAARGEQETGLPTGLIDLDHLINGLQGGQMVIVAARPGVGKTVLVTDFMRHAAKNGTPALMFSLEMGTHELNQRILAAEAGVNLTNIVNGNMSDVEWSKFNQAVERVSQLPLYVDDASETTMVDIAAKARMWVESRGVGLIVVDYLQLLRVQGRVESREQEIAAYSRQMKLLAKACNVPVVVVAQLNRESVKQNRPPQLSDLRESGALEQDADLALLIDRPSVHDADERAGEADIHVAKNRRGKTGTVTVASQLHLSRFTNIGAL